MQSTSASGSNRDVFRVDDFIKPQVAALRPPPGIIDANMGGFWSQTGEKPAFRFTVLSFSPRLPAVSTRNSPTRLLLALANLFVRGQDWPGLSRTAMGRPALTTTERHNTAQSRYDAHRCVRTPFSLQGTNKTSSTQYGALTSERHHEQHRSFCRPPEHRIPHVLKDYTYGPSWLRPT
jgi:hypothetical protein